MKPAVKWMESERIRHGLGIVEFCKLMGFLTCRYRYWLENSCGLSVQTAQKVGEVLGVDVPLEILESCRGYKAKEEESKPLTLSSPRRWRWEGKPEKQFCPNHCEWANGSGVCTMPRCMREVLHANAGEQKKD